MLAFIIAIFASLLPYRRWASFPDTWPIRSAAVGSGLLTLFAGTAIGLSGFLVYAGHQSSLGLDAMLHKTFTDPNASYNQGLVQGFAGLSIFGFLLLTPQGWLTSYLMSTGTLRAIAAWFDDPFGDPVLTGIDEAAWRLHARARARRALADREALEGPEVPDRVLAGATLGLPDWDLVVVSSRRKDGWDSGVGVFTNDACYRLGQPIERTIAGRLRTLYPLNEHRDLEVIRRSVRYDLPPALPR